MEPHNAFTDMLMRHRDMLWQMCWNRSGGDRDRCCDLLQEVSIALWENFGKLRPNASAAQERAWIRWQARSVFYQIGRQRKPTTVPLNNAVADIAPDDDERRRKELVDDLLSALDPDEQRMVGMYLEGYHGDEIGERMGISRDNYYQRMHRAVRKLRRLALVLLALLFTSAVAIAVVPQWRRVLFEGVKLDERPSDTALPQPDKTLTATPSSDTVALPAEEAPDGCCGARHMAEPMELLPLLNFADILDTSSVETLVAFPDLDRNERLTISVNGTRLTISGAEGELVKIYDMGDRLVAAQRASRFIPIDLFPNTNVYSADRFRYKIQIGNRPTLLLSL